MNVCSKNSSSRCFCSTHCSFTSNLCLPSEAILTEVNCMKNEDNYLISILGSTEPGTPNKTQFIMMSNEIYIINIFYSPFFTFTPFFSRM